MSQAQVSKKLTVEPGRLDLSTLRHISEGSVWLDLTDRAWLDIGDSHSALQKAISEERVIYGVTTGFGKLASTRIDKEDLATLQRNLILSHCTGMGPDLSENVVRLILATKAIGLARGHSGVRKVIVQILLDLLKHQVYPRIPAKGSVGASGDLTPLAHLSATLIGVGEVNHCGQRMSARDGLAIAGHEPLELGPKEGLALVNGTQVSTAMALSGLFDTENAFAAAMVAGALTLDSAKGNTVPFDQRIHTVRGQPGQMKVAVAYRNLLKGSEINASHHNRHRVQDPYSLRCQPQVMGACLDSMNFVAGTLEIEAKAVTDNPIIYSDVGEILSGANFHAEPVAFAADITAIVLAEIGAMSERRIALLVDASISGLPPFLVEASGLNSGFMVAHISAAALASENKLLAHPASVDSIPTAANQEDHVSMAAFAARRLHVMAENTSGIVAIELIAAAQGIDFHRPLNTSTSLRKAQEIIRERVAPYDKDREFASDINAIKGVVESGVFREFVNWLLPSSAEDESAGWR